MPNLKGTRTEANLMAAFSGESQARNKYTFYSSKAKKDGYVQISNIFLETAANEKEHAELWFKLLHDGMPDTMANLQDAAAGEHFEWEDMYARMATEAKEEGFEKISFLFSEVAKIEKGHEERYNDLINNVANKEVFKKSTPQVWQCSNCGHIHTGVEAPGVCPVCDHERAYFQIHAKNY